MAAADYGYSVTQEGEERLLRVGPRQSASNKFRRRALLLMCLFVLAAALTFDSSGRSDFWFFTAVLVGVVLVAYVWPATKPFSTEVRLLPRLLLTSDGRYDKGDILNLGVRSPETIMVTGRSAFDLTARVGSP